MGPLDANHCHWQQRPNQFQPVGLAADKWEFPDHPALGKLGSCHQEWNKIIGCKFKIQLQVLWNWAHGLHLNSKCTEADANFFSFWIFNYSWGLFKWHSLSGIMQWISKYIPQYYVDIITNPCSGENLFWLISAIKRGCRYVCTHYVRTDKIFR